MNPLVLANRKRGFDEADANVQWLDSFHRGQPPPVDPTKDMLYCCPTADMGTTLQTMIDKENEAMIPRRVSIPIKPATESSVNNKPATGIPKSVTDDIRLSDFVISTFVGPNVDNEEMVSASSDKPKLSDAKKNATDNGKLVRAQKTGDMPYASYPCPCCRSKFAFLKTSHPPMTEAGRISDQVPWDPKVFSVQIERIRAHFKLSHKNITPDSWPPGFKNPNAIAKPSFRAYVYYRCPCCPSKFGFSKSKLPPLNKAGRVTGQVPWDLTMFSHQIQRVRDHFVVDHPEISPLYWPIGFRAERPLKGYPETQSAVSTNPRPQRGAVAPHPYHMGAHPAWQVPSYWQPPPPHIRAHLPGTYAKGRMPKGTTVPRTMGVWPAHYAQPMPEYRPPAVLPKKCSAVAGVAATKVDQSQRKALPMQTVAKGAGAPSSVKVVQSQSKPAQSHTVTTGSNTNGSPPSAKVVQLKRKAPPAPTQKADIVGSGFLSLLAAAEVASPLPSATSTLTSYLPAPVSLVNELASAQSVSKDSIHKSTDTEAANTSILEYSICNNTDSEDSSGSAASPSQDTAEDELDVSQLSRSGKNVNVNYHCPIKSCQYVLAFDKRKAPPLSKDGEVLDNAPWIQSRFKRQVVRTRKHMQLCHPDFPREHFPTGFAFNSELVNRGFKWGMEKAKQNEEKVRYHCSVEGCKWVYGIPANLKPPMKDGRVSDQAEWPWGWLEIQIRGVRQHFRRNHPQIHRTQWPPCIAADRVKASSGPSAHSQPAAMVPAKKAKSEALVEKKSFIGKGIVKEVANKVNDRTLPVATTFTNKETREKRFSVHYKCSIQHCRWHFKFATHHCPPLAENGLLTDQVPWDRGRFLQIYKTVKYHFKHCHPQINSTQWPAGINDAVPRETPPPKKRSRVDQPVEEMTSSKTVRDSRASKAPVMYCQIISSRDADQPGAVLTEANVAAAPKGSQSPARRPPSSQRENIGQFVAAMTDSSASQLSPGRSPTVQSTALIVKEAADGPSIIDSRDSEAIGLLMLAQASREYDGSKCLVVI